MMGKNAVFLPAEEQINWIVKRRRLSWRVGTRIWEKKHRKNRKCFLFTQRAVKPRPSGRGYKAHLDWNFCLSAFSVLTGDTAAGHAVSACGEIVRPGGVGGWFVPVKFPTWECLRRKPSLVPLGNLVEAGTRSGMQSQDCLRWESPA